MQQMIRFLFTEEVKKNKNTQGSKATFSCYFPTQTASNKICPLISAMEQEGLVVLEQKVIGYIEKVRTYHKTGNKCRYGFVVFTM